MRLVAILILFFATPALAQDDFFSSIASPGDTVAVEDEMIFTGTGEALRVKCTSCLEGQELWMALGTGPLGVIAIDRTGIGLSVVQGAASIPLNVKVHLRWVIDLSITSGRVTVWMDHGATPIFDQSLQTLPNPHAGQSLKALGYDGVSSGSASVFTGGNPAMAVY